MVFFALPDLYRAAEIAIEIASEPATRMGSRRVWSLWLCVGIWAEAEWIRKAAARSHVKISGFIRFFWQHDLRTYALETAILSSSALLRISSLFFLPTVAAMMALSFSGLSFSKSFGLKTLTRAKPCLSSPFTEAGEP